MNIGTGKGGKSFQDRELGAKVRNLGLNQIMDVLNGDLYAEDEAFHKAVLLKLAGTLLPRLNEHTGEDGSPLQVNIIKYGGDVAPQPTTTDSVSN
jgi:hypothetical protein